MLNKQTVRTQSAETYIVATGIGILPEFTTWLRNVDYKRAILVVDGNVMIKQQAFVKSIQDLFESHLTYTVKPGEASKSVGEWSNILNFCLEAGITRQTPIIAIGGGVVGDLAGFVASTVLRGVPLVHIPTTLLAMVDSAIGGKTGVNHDSGKNLVGTFYQPQAVFSDLNTLETLPESEFICGFGEILKYGAIADPAILEILKTKSLTEMREQMGQLESIIQRCIKIKADIVNRDTKESGDRAYLNYGHTFAHALEKKLGYGTISHGQAVYIGMIAAGLLSIKSGGTLIHKFLDVHASQMGIKKEILTISGSDLIDGMQSDKKRKDNNLQFILLQKYGRPYIKEISSKIEIEQIWAETVEKLTELIA
jgi:3-dehydroquinate synthase